MSKFLLSRKLRLLNFHEFKLNLYQDKQSSLNCITIFSRINKFKYPRIGIIIKKKYVKLANKRNTIKRLIRESFRLNQHLLLNKDFIVKVNKKIICIDKYELRINLEKLWIYYHL